MEQFKFPVKKSCTGVSINYPYWLILILEFFLKKNIPNVWVQKISMPPPRREWEIREGGGSEAQEIPEGRAVGQ